MSQFVIITPNGENYLTAVNCGGLTASVGGAISTASKTVSADATFKLIAVDINENKFALQTSSLSYLSFVNGGGVGGPNSSECVIHTDAQVSKPQQWPGAWEKLTVQPQPNGKCSLVTENGYYISAVDGGNIGPAGTAQVPQAVWTTSDTIGANETFTLKAV